MCNNIIAISIVLILLFLILNGIRAGVIEGYLKKVAAKFKFKYHNYKITGKIKNHNIVCKYTGLILLSGLCFKIKLKGGKKYPASIIKEYILEDFSNSIKLKDKMIDLYLRITSDDRLKTVGLMSNNVRKIFKRIIRSVEYFEIKNNYIKIEVNPKKPEIVKKVIDDFILLSEKLLDEESTEELLKKNILKDKDDNVRFNNLELLTRVKETGNYDAFFKELTKDKNFEIAILACHALKKDGIPYLIKLLNTDNYENICDVLLELEEYLEDERVIKAVCKLLESSRMDFAAEAINTLEMSKNKDTIPYVLDFMNKNENLIKIHKRVQVELLDYIHTFKIIESYEWLINIIKNEKKYDEEVICLAINNLGKLGNINAVEYLLPFVKIIQTDEIRQSAKKAIGFLQKDVPADIEGDMMIVEESEEGQLSIDDKKDGNLSLDKE